MKKVCAACGGSGQVGYFQGVSRFLITWEECQECYGTGYIDTGNDEAATETQTKDVKGFSKKKRDDS